MIGLIDADILVFRAGFATERNFWFVKVDEVVHELPYKKDAIDKLDELLPGKYSREEGVDYTMWSERKLEPANHAFHLVNIQMNKIMEACNLTEFDVRCYLSGGKNFRYGIAETRPYKGNRDKVHRPTHEEEIRQYIRGKWETVVTDGIEADDQLGIDQMSSDEETCIITIDKDLDMIPGLHYNFKDEVHYAMTEDQSWKKFCLQLLTGDSTDNIPGLPKVGAKKAANILEGVATKNMLGVVAVEYASRSGKRDWFRYLKEQAKLLWIMRHPTDPEVDSMLEGYDGDFADNREDSGTIETDLFG